jgi:hypothetical protein
MWLTVGAALAVRLDDNCNFFLMELLVYNVGNMVCASIQLHHVNNFDNDFVMLTRDSTLFPSLVHGMFVPSTTYLE